MRPRGSLWGILIATRSRFDPFMKRECELAVPVATTSSGDGVVAGRQGGDAEWSLRGVSRWRRSARSHRDARLDGERTCSNANRTAPTRTGGVHWCHSSVTGDSRCARLHETSRSSRGRRWRSLRVARSISMMARGHFAKDERMDQSPDARSQTFARGCVGYGAASGTGLLRVQGYFACTRCGVGPRSTIVCCDPEVHSTCGRNV